MITYGYAATKMEGRYLCIHKKRIRSGGGGVHLEYVSIHSDVHCGQYCRSF